MHRQRERPAQACPTHRAAERVGAAG
eukprot:SAG11_NODE_5192_length_1634_cov_1.570033_4_plen_25_part_01